MSYNQQADTQGMKTVIITSTLLGLVRDHQSERALDHPAPDEAKAIALEEEAEDYWEEPYDDSYDQYDYTDAVLTKGSFGGGGGKSARGGGKKHTTKSAARRNKQTSCYSTRHIRAIVGR